MDRLHHAGCARDPETGNQTTTHILAEVCGALNNNDIQRAKERAATPESATGTRTIPATAATAIPDVQQAHTSNVQVVLPVRN